MEDLLLYLTNGVVMGTTYALAALGVTLIVGIMGVINFAHGEFYVLAGYFSALFAQAVGLDPYSSMFIAVVLVFLCGLVVERVLIRPTYGAELYSLIITFILYIILQNVYLVVFGPYPNKPPNWVNGASELFGLFYYGNQRLASFVAAAAVIAAFMVVLHKTWLGRVIRSVAMDREMAAMLGGEHHPGEHALLRPGLRAGRLRRGDPDPGLPGDPHGGGGHIAHRLRGDDPGRAGLLRPAASRAGCSWASWKTWAWPIYPAATRTCSVS